MGIEVQFFKKKNFWSLAVPQSEYKQHCEAVHLNMVKMVNLMSILPQLKIK